MTKAGSEWRLGEVSMAWIIRNTLSTCGLRLEAPHKDNMCRSIVDNRTSVKSNISNKLRNLGLKIFQKNLKNTLRYSGTYLNVFIHVVITRKLESFVFHS